MFFHRPLPYRISYYVLGTRDVNSHDAEMQSTKQEFEVVLKFAVVRSDW
jgi:hypothetical protein